MARGLTQEVPPPAGTGHPSPPLPFRCVFCLARGGCQDGSVRGEVAASTCAAGKSPRAPFVAFKTAQSSCSEDVLRILKPLKPASWRPGFPTPTPGQSHRTSKQSARKRAGGAGVNLGAPRRWEHSGAPARSARCCGRPRAPPHTPHPARRWQLSCGWDGGRRMTGLLTDRCAETSLVIYWLSAPDEKH